MSLELFAMRWLRWHRRCVIVMTERSPREWFCGRPDVLGILPNRFTVEIEIKRTLYDFRANHKKRCVDNREKFPEKFPRQFYFLIPPDLSLRVMAELPAWSGLMAGPKDDEAQEVKILRRAPLNPKAKRLSFTECVRAVGMLTNENLSLTEWNMALTERCERERLERLNPTREVLCHV